MQIYNIKTQQYVSSKNWDHQGYSNKISLCNFIYFQFLQRMIKYSEAKLKCIKARNEYILQLEATNATLNKYYGTDMDSLLDVST